MYAMTDGAWDRLNCRCLHYYCCFYYTVLLPYSADCYRFYLKLVGTVQAKAAQGTVRSGCSLLSSGYHIARERIVFHDIF